MFIAFCRYVSSSRYLRWWFMLPIKRTVDEAPTAGKLTTVRISNCVYGLAIVINVATDRNNVYDDRLESKYLEVSMVVGTWVVSPFSLCEVIGRVLSYRVMPEVKSDVAVGRLFKRIWWKGCVRKWPESFASYSRMTPKIGSCVVDRPRPFCVFICEHRGVVYLYFGWRHSLPCNHRSFLIILLCLQRVRHTSVTRSLFGNATFGSLTTDTRVLFANVSQCSFLIRLKCSRLSEGSFRNLILSFMHPYPLHVVRLNKN